MVEASLLAHSPLLAGLAPADLTAIAEQMRPRVFEPGEVLCRAGDPSDRFWLITGGLVHVLAETPGSSTGEVVARERKGGSVGEVGVITGEERANTVLASLRTSALELQASEFAELARRYPQILINIVRTQRDWLARAHARSLEAPRGESVGLAAGPSLSGALERLVQSARRATPRPVNWLDRGLSFAGALTAADDLLLENATVLIPTELEPGTIAVLLKEVDRVIALAGTASEAAQLGAVVRPAVMRSEFVEAVLVGKGAIDASRSWPRDAPVRVVRTCPRQPASGLGVRDVGWLARHLTRTKLGLALGAGGAKGYAHVGALQVLEEAGYEVDCVSGSSIGAIVGSYLALGMDSVAIDSTLRSAFDEANTAAIFKTSLGGGATGIDAMTRLLRETTADRTFADTVMPLAVMTADLSVRAPAPLREGPLWQALLAATALAGVFPAYEREGHRLVDGLALVPVPTGSLLEDGADITVSVNLMSHDTLERWPEDPTLEPPPERRRRPGMLDNLLEVMDLSQLDTSVRHAGLADVVMTPRFGPCHWRDFHLADLFMAAGRAAAREQLPALQALGAPASTGLANEREGEVVAPASEV